jgi:hypothetical protein
MPGNGNGGGGLFSESFLPTTWAGGEGGTQAPPSGGGSELTAGEGGTGGGIDFSGLVKPKPEPTEPAPRVPVIREARNVQRANIDRSSFHDPSVATLDMGTEYLQSRNATNPRPQGDAGVGAVGYEFVPSNERLY